MKLVPANTSWQKPYSFPSVCLSFPPSVPPFLWQTLNFFILNRFHSNFIHASPLPISRKRSKLGFLSPKVLKMANKMAAIPWNSLTHSNFLLSQWISIELHACITHIDILDEFEIGLLAAHAVPFQDGQQHGCCLLNFFFCGALCQSQIVLVKIRFKFSTKLKNNLDQWKIIKILDLSRF